MRLKYVVFKRSTKRFIAGLKYLISAENRKSYLVGSRSRFPIPKTREGKDYMIGKSILSNELNKTDTQGRKDVAV